MQNDKKALGCVAVQTWYGKGIGAESWFHWIRALSSEHVPYLYQMQKDWQCLNQQNATGAQTTWSTTNPASTTLTQQTVFTKPPNWVYCKPHIIQHWPVLTCRVLEALQGQPSCQTTASRSHPKNKSLTLIFCHSHSWLMVFMQSFYKCGKWTDQAVDGNKYFG